MRFSRACFLLFAACLLAAAGCKEEEGIKKYPRTHEDREMLQLRVAILPHEDNVFFIRLSGPKTLVEQQTAAFEALVRSAKFDDRLEQPLLWTEPNQKDWTKDPNVESRVASYRIETKPKALELKITIFPRDKFGLLENLNRWQKEMAVPVSLDLEDVQKYIRDEKLGDDEITWVTIDSRGIYLKPREVIGQAKKKDDSLPFKFDVPKGWIRKQAQDGFTAAAFEVRDKATKEKAAVTLTQAGGSVGENINRWRGKQLGLPEMDPKDAERKADKLKVAGVDAAYVDLANANRGLDKNGKKQLERIVAVIVPLDDSQWVIRLSGQDDWVGRNKGDFEVFVKSFKLEAR